MKHRKAIRTKDAINHPFIHKIRLSSQDKNLVSLMWILEIAIDAIVNMNVKHIPEGKTEMYAGIRDSLRDTRTLVRKINDKFTQEILSVFGEDYADDLANAMLSVVTLLETMNPKQIKKVMKALE